MSVADVGRRRRTNDELAGDLEAHRAAAVLGEELRRTRQRRRMTQQRVADRMGISRTRYSGMERGQGASAPLEVWFRAAAVLDRPLAVALSRDVISPLADAGHVAAQELVLRLARRHGRSGRFELSTRASRSAGSVDVGLRDDACQVLVLVEIWNALSDLGSAARTTARKVVEAEGLAEFRGYRVATCWLLLDTAANRGVVRRHPEVFRGMFPGSSALWARALAHGACPPAGAGVAWIDPRTGRITELRLPS